MKRNFTYMVYALFAIIAISCVKVDIKPVSFDTVATLHLRNTDLVETRADGIEGLNENYIGDIQCFFCDADSNILYSTGVISVGQHDKGTGVNKPLSIPSDNLAKIFPLGTDTCNLYVVANAPKVTLDSDPTISDIEKVAITLSKDENNVLKGKQDSFVMDGYATVKKKSDNSIGGIVELKRAAAKIQVSLQVNNEIIVGEGEDAVTWTPDLENVKIYYNNSATTSKVSAVSENAGDLETFSQENDPFTFTEGNSFSSGTQTQPFYSYPRKWSDNDAADAANITLVIPWQATLKSGVEVYNTYTYQIPVNYDAKELVRNNIYQLTVKVGILGSLTGEVEITPSYIVVDWQTQVINTDLTKATYLVVDENVVVMNNVDTYSVGYASSDPVTAVITNITKPDYSKEDISEIEIYSGTGINSVAPESGNKSEFSVSVIVGEDGKGEVVLSHTLNNNNKTDGYDYVPYSVTVKVTNSIGYTEEIEYTQYPAMYIIAEKNPGGNMVSGVDKGHVFVYNNQADSGDQWWRVRTCYTGGNQNPNMYIITTNSLDGDSVFILSDSRSSTAITGSDLGLTSSFNNKSLQYYYPSLTSSDNYISPKFRIASSYGKCNNAISYNDARKRCAAYQEYGFPAGRWRVPTTAEMKYIATISSKGWIPHLFSDDGSYWSATERITYYVNGTVTETNSTTNNAFVRCVYDEWYWTDKCELKTFTWGDQQH